MLYDLAVAVGGLVALVTLWFGFDLLARRVRTVHADGEEPCADSGIRCLGCYFTGQCQSRRKPRR